MPTGTRQVSLQVNLKSEKTVQNLKFLLHKTVTVTVLKDFITILFISSVKIWLFLLISKCNINCSKSESIISNLHVFKWSLIFHSIKLLSAEHFTWCLLLKNFHFYCRFLILHEHLILKFLIYNFKQHTFVKIHIVIMKAGFNIHQVCLCGYLFLDFH